MRVYLTDFGHTYFGISPSTIPLGIAYIGAYLKQQFQNIDVRLFKYPEKYLTVLKTDKPDYVGMGLYNWNQNLSVELARITRHLYPKTILIAGGLNVPKNNDNNFIETCDSLFDYYVPFEGELPMESIINGNPQGCFGSRGKPYPPIPFTEDILSRIPSPYLTGLVSDMLSDKLLSPVLQTMRGCPYSCTFCVGGQKETSKIRRFPYDRAIEEILYLKTNAKNRLLRITDDNLGMFDEDVSLAHFIERCSKLSNYPEALKVYTNKKPDDNVKSIMLSLKKFIPFNISLQTGNPESLKSIKRKNTTYDEMKSAFEWAKQHGLITATELIHGFPYETYETYLEAINQVYSMKVDSSSSTELWMLPNTEIASKESREKHGIETRFILGADALSIINGKVICEFDEHVVQTKYMSIEDHYNLCKLDLFVCLTLYYGYFRELTFYAMNLGIKPTVLFETIRGVDGFAQLFLDYIQRIKSSHFKTREEAQQHIESLLHQEKEIPPTRHDGVVIGGFVFNKKFGEMIDRYIGVIHRLCATAPPDVLYDLKLLTLSMIIDPERPVEKRHINLSYDFKGWVKNNYEDLKEEPTTIELTTPNYDNVIKLSERAKTLRNRDERIQNFYRHTNSSGIRMVVS